MNLRPDYPPLRTVGLIDEIEPPTLFDPAPYGPPLNFADVGYLYALWRHGWIKLGWSVDPPRRAYQLGGRLLATTDRDKTKRDELRVHHTFRRWHMAHEWYHDVPPIRSFVARFPHQYQPPPTLHIAA